MTRTYLRAAMLVGATAGLLGALVAPVTAATTPVTATSGGAAVTLDNDHYSPGETISITGSGFAEEAGAGDAVLAVKLNGDAYESGDFPWVAGGASMIDPDTLPMSGGSDGYAAFRVQNGQFSGTLTIPADWDVAEQPSWFLTMLGGSLGTVEGGKRLKPVSLSARFALVDEDQGYAAVTSTGHRPGGQVEVALRNFKSDAGGGQKVAFKVDGAGAVLQCVQTDADGDGSASVPIPAVNDAPAVTEHVVNVLAGTACGEGAQAPVRSLTLPFTVDHGVSVPATVAYGEDIVVTGTGWKNQAGDAGSVVSVLINFAQGTPGAPPTHGEGVSTKRVVVSELTGEVLTDKRLHAQVKADANGDWTARIPFPTPSNSSLTSPWQVSEKHRIRLLTGTALDGDTTRSHYVDFTVTPGAEPLAVGKAATIAGTSRVGQRLAATAPTFNRAPATLSRQWLRNGAAIRGATGASYTLVPADRGKQVSVRFTAASGDQTVTSTSAARKVAAGLISMKKSPKIKGAAKQGKKLKVTKGSWSAPSVKIRYQWLRNGKPIKKATKAKYKLKRADRGKKIRVRVIVTKPGYAKVTKLTKVKRVKK